MLRVLLRRTGCLLELVGLLLLLAVLAALIRAPAIAGLGVMVTQWLVMIVSLLAIVTALF